MRVYVLAENDLTEVFLMKPENYGSWQTNSSHTDLFPQGKPDLYASEEVRCSAEAIAFA